MLKNRTRERAPGSRGRIKSQFSVHLSVTLAETLNEVAKETGVSRSELIEQLCADGLRRMDGIRRETDSDTQERRRALIRSLCGAAAGAPISVEDFLREKREENERQERRYQGHAQ